MTKWQFKDGTRYDGETHVIGGQVYSGKTRTPASRSLIPVEPKPKGPPKSRMTTPTRKPKKKPGPKPKGSTAWD